jgi:hypothetical protein
MQADSHLNLLQQEHHHLAINMQDTASHTTSVSAQNESAGRSILGGFHSAAARVKRAAVLYLLTQAGHRAAVSDVAAAVLAKLGSLKQLGIHHLRFKQLLEVI